MSNQYKCPGCATVLKTAAPVSPGAKIKCPKCAMVFAVPGGAPAPAAVKPAAPAARPAAPAAGAPRPAGAPAATAPRPPAAPVAPRPMPPTAPKAPVASAPAPKPAASATAPLPAALSETAPMPAVRKPSLLSRMPRKLRKVVVQGMMLSSGVALVIYLLFFFAAFTALDGAVTKLTAPPDKDKDKGGSASRPKKPLHLAYLTKDFNGIGVYRPERMLKSSLLADAPVDDMAKQWIEKSGIDPRKLETVVAYTEAYPGGTLPAGAGPVEFTSKSYGFAVTFPEAPSRMTSARTFRIVGVDPDYSQESTTIYVPLRLGSSAFSVEIADLTAKGIAAGAGPVLEQEAKTPFFGGGTVKDITVDGHPGKERISPVRKERIFVANNRFYRVMVDGAGAKPPDVTRFLESFKPLPGSDEAGFDAGVPVSFGFVLHFTEPVDGKAILEKTLKKSKDVEFQGKGYSRSESEKSDGVPVCGYIADEQTIVLAPEPTLRKMLTVEGEVQSPLTDRLGLLDLDSPNSTVFVMEPFTSTIAETMKGMKMFIPPPFGGLKPIMDVPERVKALAVTVNLEVDPLIKVTLENADPTTADDTHKKVKQTIDAAKGLYALQFKQQLEMSLPPDVKPDVMKTIDSLLEGITTEAEGKNVVVTIKRPDGIHELMKKGAPMLKGMMGAGANQKFNEVGRPIR